MRVTRCAQDFQVSACHTVVGRGGVVVQVRDDHAWAGKAGVEVGVSIGDFFSAQAGQPDHLANAQQRTQGLFNLGLAARRVAVVNEHAALGDQRGAFAVDFDAATLQRHQARHGDTARKLSP